MRNKLTARVHRHSKPSDGTRNQFMENYNFIYNRTDSEERESELYAPNHSAHNFIKLEDLSGDSENEVLPSIKRESTSSNGSPRKRKVRVRTQSQTPTNGISRLHVSKKTGKLFKEKAFESLANEVPPSIKRKPSFEDSSKIKKPSAKTGRKTSILEISSSLTTSLQNEENEVFPLIKREPSFEDSLKITKPGRKTSATEKITKPGRKTSETEISSNLTTSLQNEENEVFPLIKREPSFEDSLKITKPGRKTSATEISSNFTTSLQNKENGVFPSKKKRDPSLSKSSAKLDTESRCHSFSTSKTPLKKQWSPPRTPPTTPYALNRPQRNRIPPLAYWRGEHRTFRILENGDIVLIDVHIPEYTEEPQRKRRKLSEKKNPKVIKTELYDED